VYAEDVPKAVREIRPAETSVTAFVGRTSQGPIDQPTLVRTEAEFVQTFGSSTEDGMLGLAARLFFENGGRDALIVRVGELGTLKGVSGTTAADIVGDRAAQTGIYALDHAEAFNLLCIPPFAPGRDVPKATWDAAVAYCRERRAILLVDPPRAWSSAAAVTPQAISDLVEPDANAALYVPRLVVADPADREGTVALAPSGAVAGVIARTDRAHGVWKAPAGTEATILGATGLSFGLSDADPCTVNVQGVNALRQLPGPGLVVWGARTLRGADQFTSEWKYLPVRRTVLFIEESIRAGTTWVGAEPNGEPLWAQIRASVGSFLDGLFRAGAFQGAKQEQAYFVKCDSETTTQGDIEAGRVTLLVGFAPLRPAEFVVLRIDFKAAHA